MTHTVEKQAITIADAASGQVGWHQQVQQQAHQQEQPQEQTGEQQEPQEQSQEQGQTPGAGENEGDLGFPANTAVDDMTAEQKAAYWKNQSKVQQRKYEAEASAKRAADQALEAARLASLSAEDRATEEAKAAAKREAIAEARAEFLPTLAIAELRARGLDAGEAKERVEFLDLSKFLDDDGQLVSERFDRIVPPAQSAPGGQSPADAFRLAGGTPNGQRTSLSQKSVRERAEQIKTNQH